MSSILSADDLNDFISPGVACIKPVETLPAAPPGEEDAYEVTTEDRVAAAQAPPAQISLTDCLACSGCVTSAEAVLVSLQSHDEVCRALDSEPGASATALRLAAESSHGAGHRFDGIGHSPQSPAPAGRIFIASLSPQVRASLAATYGVTERQAGHMVEQLLCGRDGVASGGTHGNRFAWVIDTNAMREVCLAMESEEVSRAAHAPGRKTPVLTSACPGWVCYAEKTKPGIIPHLSPLKSPQALSGTLLKSVLSARFGVHPGRIWHLAIMPCLDKKLEASRQELTDEHWLSGRRVDTERPVRDVDCVITTHELLMLADERGVSFPSLPRTPLAPKDRIPFPDRDINNFLFPPRPRRNGIPKDKDIGTSGGFFNYLLRRQLAQHPGSILRAKEATRDNSRTVSDWVEYTVCLPAAQESLSTPGNSASSHPAEAVVFRAARCFGNKNIQNLVRRLGPPKISALTGRPVERKLKRVVGHKASMERPYDYIEVMACPGGCTNGGGQIRAEDLGVLQSAKPSTSSKAEWKACVDEAYFSMSDTDEDDDTEAESGVESDDASDGGESVAPDELDGVSPSRVLGLIERWEVVTGVPRDRLLYTSFRAVVSDVGKARGGMVNSAIELSSKEGGGW